MPSPSPSPIAVDLIIFKSNKMNDWLRSAAVGFTFVLLFFVVHWYFSEFLLSESARNWFFSGHFNKPYWARMGPYEFKFWEYDGAASGGNNRWND